MASTTPETFFVRLDVEFFRDEKVRALRRRLGYEGVGIYLSLLSLHRKYQEYGFTIPLRLLDEIAEEDLIIPPDKIHNTVDTCLEIGLFSKTESEENFYSNRLRNDLIKQEDTKRKQSEGGIKAMQKRYGKSDF